MDVLLAAIRDNTAILNGHVANQDLQNKNFDVHNAEITEKLSSLSNDVSAGFVELRTSNAVLVNRCNELESEVDHLKTSLAEVSARNTAVEAEVANLKTSLSLIAERDTALESEVGHLKTSVTHISSDVKRVQTLGHSNVLSISGLPETVGLNDQDNTQAVISFASFLGVTLVPADITKAVRMRSTNPAVTAKKMPRPIRITFTDASKRNDLLNKAKEAKELHSRDIFPDLPSFKIYLNEWLPRETYQLLRATRSFLKDTDYKYVWPREGSVLVRRDSNPESLTIRIDSVDELTTKLP